MYGDLNYNYFSLYIFIFLGIVTGGILHDFFQSEHKYSDLIDYWKNYSSNLTHESLPKEYHLENSISLYMDITGIYNFYLANKKIKEFRNLIDNFYNDFEKKHIKSKINMFDDGKGHFWFVSYEFPSHSDSTYSETMAEFAIGIRDTLRSFLWEMKLDFSFRMGMDSGVYIDYELDSKNQILRIFKSNRVFQGAREMENIGIHNEVLVSQRAYDLLRRKFIFTKNSLNREDSINIHSYILQDRDKLSEN